MDFPMTWLKSLPVKITKFRVCHEKHQLKMAHLGMPVLQKVMGST